MISEKTFLELLTTTIANHAKNAVACFHRSCYGAAFRFLQQIPVNHATFYNCAGCGNFVVYVVCHLSTNVTGKLWRNLMHHVVEACSPDYFSLVTIGPCVQKIARLQEILFTPFSYMCLDNGQLTIRVDSDFKGQQRAFSVMNLSSMPTNLSKYMFYDHNAHDSPMGFFFNNHAFGQTPKYNVGYPLIQNRFVYYEASNPLTVTLGPTVLPSVTPVALFNSVAFFWKPMAVLSSIQILPFTQLSFFVYLVCAVVMSILLVLFLRNDDKTPVARVLQDTCFVLMTCVVHTSKLSSRTVFRYCFASFLLSSWYAICCVIATMCKASMVAKLNSPLTNLTTSVTNGGFADHMTFAPDRTVILKRLLEGGYWVGAQFQLDVVLDIWGIRSQVYFVYESERNAFESYAFRCVNNDTNFGCRCTRKLNRHIYEAGLIMPVLRNVSLRFAYQRTRRANQSIDSVVTDQNVRLPDFNFRTIRIFFNTVFYGHVFGIIALIIEAVLAAVEMRKNHANFSYSGSRKNSNCEDLRLNLDRRRRYAAKFSGS